MVKQMALLCLLAAPCVWSQTLVPGGNVSGSWTALGSPYIVMGNITVPINQYLTLEAGVEVRFQGDYYLVVQGGLCAWGNEADSVKFKAAAGQNPGSWQYLKYQNSWPDSSRLLYCLIEAGDRAVWADGSTVFLENCTIQRQALSGVRGTTAQIALINCTITDCSGSGLSLDNSSAQVINGNITGCYGLPGHGINVLNGSTVLVNGGFIGNNLGWGINGGSNTVQIDTVNLQSVEITGNGNGGVSLSFCSILLGARAIIHDNDWHGIYLLQTSANIRNMTISTNLQDGIFCSGANIEVTSSILDHNGSWGVEVQSPAVGNLSYNDYFGNSSGNYLGANPGTGSIEIDPLYENYLGRNFNLQPESPCVDSGSPNDPLDPDGTQTDMGALYLDQTSVPRVIAPPQEYQVLNAYPNPFNPNLTIQIYSRVPGNARLTAYSTDGRLAATIWRGSLFPGVNELHWQADRFASGQYVLRLESPQGPYNLSRTLVK